MVLTGYKVVVGYLGGSPALIADGIHSFTDVIGTSVIIASTRLSSRPADSKHPFGYGKAEFMSALFIYTVLVALAIFIFAGGLMLLLRGGHETPHLVTLFGGLVSVMYNVMMYRLGVCAGKRTGSPALLANAFENRADAISSVAVCIGIVLAITIHPAADPLAAMAVGVVILVNCIHEGRKAIEGLMDKSPSEVVVSRVRDFVQKQESVLDVSFVNVRPTGTGYWIDLGIQLTPELPVGVADDVARQVQQALMAQSPQLDEVQVYVEPKASVS
jgi:cation diffusion facilitator family transporter